MTANNIDIVEMIQILNKMKGFGIKLIDMDMIPNEEVPGMNKLVLHPVKPDQNGYVPSSEERNLLRDKEYGENTEFDISDPDLNAGGNEIFGLFDNIV